MPVKATDAVRDGRHLMENDESLQAVRDRLGYTCHPAGLIPSLRNAASWICASEQMGRERFIADIAPVVEAYFDAMPHPNYRYQQRTGEEGV